MTIKVTEQLTMPITQQRMIDMISAAEQCYQSFLDHRAATNAALDLHAQGVIDLAELTNQLYAAGLENVPPTAVLIHMAKERQHFKEWAKRNDYNANRRAAVKAGAKAQQFTNLKDKRERINRPGMLRTYDEEQLAKAQKPAFTIDPGAAIASLGEDVASPTAEQFAADEALFADSKDELEEHLAGLRKDNQ